MTPVSQPKRSRLCGQAVVASILGVSLEEGISAVGHKRGTKAQDLRTALNRRGYSVGLTKLTAYNRIPDNAILHVTQKGRKKNWHWMLIWDGHIFDPANRWNQPGGNPDGWTITSFMEVAEQ